MSAAGTKMRSKRSQSLKSRSRAATMRTASGRFEPAVLREAARVFDLELSSEQQLDVAEEIAVTRATELCMAFPNVIRVSFGYRLRRDVRRRRHRVVPQTCVRFLVAGKWRGSRAKSEQGRIPSRLLAFCWVGGERLLCAVPTDVEDAVPHLHVHAEGARIAVDWNGTSVSGVIACALQRNTVSDRVYGLGCRHVLSLSAYFFDQVTWGAQVHMKSPSSPTILGPTRSIAGDLGPKSSFDAQLFEATDLPALQQALPVQELATYAHNAAELPSTYNIVTPQETIGAKFVEFIDQPSYEVDGHDIGHRRLVRSNLKTGTNPGDSGSPIVSEDGRWLLGMHIAGMAGLDSAGHYLAISYMIPAWELFKPANYRNVAAGEIWTIVKP